QVEVGPGDDTRARRVVRLGGAQLAQALLDPHFLEALALAGLAAVVMRRGLAPFHEPFAFVGEGPASVAIRDVRVKGLAAEVPRAIAAIPSPDHRASVGNRRAFSSRTPGTFPRSTQCASEVLALRSVV